MQVSLLCLLFLEEIWHRNEERRKSRGIVAFLPAKEYPLIETQERRKRRELGLKRVDARDEEKHKTEEQEGEQEGGEPERRKEERTEDRQET